MENKEIYSHFIQKEIINRWAVTNKIYYTIYDDKDDHQNFIINDLIKNQSTTEIDSYPNEIKKGIKVLEKEGNKIIDKILKQKTKVALIRKEVITLKFYFIVNTIRTNLLKVNIEDLNDDYLLRKIIEKANKTPKEIQELKLKIIIEKYNDFKKGADSTFFLKERVEIIKILKNNKNEFLKMVDEISELFDLESSIKLQLNLLIKSKLAFVKFPKGKLLLTEAGSFQEISRLPYSSAKYDFSVISPNMGFLFIKESLIHKTIGFSAEDSLIFTFDFKEENIIQYQKEAEMQQAQIRFLLAKVKNMRDPEEMAENNSEFDLTERPKFYTNEDQFEYIIHSENKEVADMCNAMMLVHCKNSYIIYKIKKTYYDAIEMNRTKNLYKLEKSE